MTAHKSFTPTGLRFNPQLEGILVGPPVNPVVMVSGSFLTKQNKDNEEGCNLLYR